MIWTVPAFLVGVIIGYLLTIAKPNGTLKVDHSIEGESFIFLESKVTVDQLQKQKYAVFKVELHDYLPR